MIRQRFKVVTGVGDLTFEKNLNDWMATMEGTPGFKIRRTQLAPAHREVGFAGTVMFALINYEFENFPSTRVQAQTEVLDPEPEMSNPLRFDKRRS